jgi:hypothetical protein
LAGVAAFSFLGAAAFLGAGVATGAGAGTGAGAAAVSVFFVVFLSPAILFVLGAEVVEDISNALI